MLVDNKMFSYKYSVIRHACLDQTKRSPKRYQKHVNIA